MKADYDCVVDTNIVAYFYISGEKSLQAEQLLTFDSLWNAPILWRSEFRSVLMLYIGQDHLSIEDAQSIMNEAEDFLSGNEYEVNSFEIFDLVSSSNCSAYDCEFVALAKRLGLDSYTSDKKVLKEFPEIASDLKSIKV